MNWKSCKNSPPESDGKYRCQMKDGTEKELIFVCEHDWNENTLSDVYWDHWFETEEDKTEWSPLEEDQEPQYWMDNNN